MKLYDLINDEPIIRTYKGKWVNVFNPTPEMFDIEDIAHALSHQSRFGGHVNKFYNVANHSILCFQEALNKGLNKKIQLTALMHDASEAYLVDIPRPIKKQFSQYKNIEDGLMYILSDIFEFIWPISKEIEEIDNYVLRLEWDYLMIQNHNDEVNIPIYTIEESKQMFLDIFKDLRT